MLSQVHEQQQLELQKLLLELEKKKGRPSKKRKKRATFTEEPGIPFST